MVRALSSRRSQRRLLLLSVLLTLGAGIILFHRSRTVGYVPGVEAAHSDEITHSLERTAPKEAPRIVWQDVAGTAGLRFHHFHGRRTTQLPEDMGSGAAWGDYDNDGDPDLFVVNESGPLGASPEELAASPARSALFRNEGDGTFKDVTEEAGLGVRGLGMGAAWGDADGDGDLDLLVSRYGTLVLFRNEHGVFEDVSGPSGVGGPEGLWTGVSWADYDRDGALDFYVCGYVRYSHGADQTTSRMYEATVPSALNPSSFAPERNLLFHNKGGLRFEEVATVAGVDDTAGRSLSAAWADFDGDLWPDLYVANDISDNAMYRNRGDGTFDDVSHSAWVADYRGAMGLAIGDWDGDLDPDIFITHWIAQENALYVNQKGNIAASERDPLHFTDEADLVGLGQIALDYIGWGTDFLDYDNDGRLDLLVVNGSTFQREDDPSLLQPMKDLIFWNGGAKAGFFEASAVSGPGFEGERVGRGAAVADYDGDGDLDAAIVVNGGDIRLLQNQQSTGNHFVRVVLRGARGTHAPESTPFANGALVKLTASGSSQVRFVGGSPSYLSQSPPGEVHFGLGGGTTIDRIDVTWPSGEQQSFANLPADRTLAIFEGRADVEVRGGAIPRSSASRSDVLRFWDRFNRATDLRVKERDISGAASAYEEALALDPRHEDSLYYLGQCRQELGQRDAARGSLERLVACNPKSARGHLALASLFSSPDDRDLMDIPAAEEQLRLAHAINMEETGPVILLGELLIAKGDRAQAAQFLEGAARTNPKSVEAPLLSGYLRYASGDKAGAATFYRAAIGAARVEAPPKGVMSEGDQKAQAPTPKAAPPLRETTGKTLFGDVTAKLRPLLQQPDAPSADLATVFAPIEARAVALVARSPK